VPAPAARRRPSPEPVLPELPSLFTPVVTLREGGDAMARAVALAPEAGAGTLAWVRSFARLEAAVVLEPEESLASARLALMAGANALADALSALGPPEVAVALRWPAGLLVGGALAGRLRLAWPGDAAEDAPPAWLVVAAEARLAYPGGWEGGHSPGETALFEEGWLEEEVSAPALTAAWARHLMAGLAEWQRQGLRKVAERYLARLEPDPDWPQARRGLDPGTGDLILEEAGTRHRRSLREALR
jgi:hypothetical protein